MEQTDLTEVNSLITIYAMSIENVAFVTDFLQANGIEFQIMHHEAVVTCEQSRNTIKVDNCAACKNLFVKDKYSNRHYLVVLISDKAANMRTLAAYVNTRKFEFGTEDKLQQIMNIYRGAVSPFGLLNDKLGIVGTVLIDKDIFNYPLVKFHPNDNSATIIIATSDLKKYLNIINRRVILVDTDSQIQL